MTHLQCPMVENTVLVQLLREGYVVSENVQVLMFSATISITEFTTCETNKSIPDNPLSKLLDILKYNVLYCALSKI